MEDIGRGPPRKSESCPPGGILSFEIPKDPDSSSGLLEQMVLPLSFPGFPCPCPCDVVLRQLCTGRLSIRTRINVVEKLECYKAILC